MKGLFFYGQLFFGTLITLLFCALAAYAVLDLHNTMQAVWMGASGIIAALFILRPALKDAIEHEEGK